MGFTGIAAPDCLSEGARRCFFSPPKIIIMKHAISVERKPAALWNGFFLSVLSLLLCLLPGLLKSQELLYSMQQIEGSESEVKAVFAKDELLRSGEIYVFHIKPMVCPRCEGLINPLVGMLKKADPQSRIVMVVDYPRKKPVYHYVQERNFSIDYLLIDTTARFAGQFNYSAGRTSIPFCLKIDLGSGRLLRAMPLLGISLNQSLADELVNDHSPEAPAPRALADTKPQGDVLQPNTLPILPFGRFTALREDNKQPYSQPLKLVRSKDEKYWIFLDDIAQKPFVYDNQGNFVGTLSPSTAEKKKYVSPEIQEEIYQFLEKSNILNVIYLDIYPTPDCDDCVCISTSLPEVYYEPDTSIAYYNKIAFIKKRFDNQVITIDTIADLPSQGFVLHHKKAIFLPEFTFIPVVKGWPVVGTGQLSQYADPGVNPFEDGFYDDAPLAAMYSRDGQFISTIGRLPALYKQLHAGYYFSHPVATQYRNKLWLTDGRSGQIQAFRLSEGAGFQPEHTINLFPAGQFLSIGADSKPATAVVFNGEKTETRYNTTAYYELNKPAAGRELPYLQNLESQLGKQIVQLEAWGDKLYVLVRENGQYYLHTLDQQGGNQVIQYIGDPAESARGKLTYCRLFVSPQRDELQLFGIYVGEQAWIASTVLK